MFWKKCFITAISQQGGNLGMRSQTFKRCKILPAFCGDLCIFMISTMSGVEKWIQPQVQNRGGGTLVVTRLQIRWVKSACRLELKLFVSPSLPLWLAKLFFTKDASRRTCWQRARQSGTTLEIMVLWSPQEPPPTVILFLSPDSHISCVVGSCNAHQQIRNERRPPGASPSQPP